LPSIAKRAAAVLIEVNPMASELSPLMDVCVRAGAALALPRIFD
jgi:hypothetical protein